MSLTDSPTSAARSSAGESPTAGHLDPAARERSRRFRALAVIAIAQLMIVLDASVVIVALPSAQRALHISTANRQWVMTAYTLAFGSLLLLGGRIADYVGRRRMFIIGLVGFALASALGGLAPDEAILFGARALQGAFAALMAPAALSLLTTTFTEPKERAMAFGVYGGISGGGAAIGLVLGGVLTQYASWRWTLLINVPIAALAVVGALREVSESRVPARGSYDLPGAATATLGFFLLVFGCSTAATDGWTSTLSIGTLAGAAIALAAFVVIELRSTHPLLPLRVVLDRNRGGAYGASLLIGSALLGSFLFLTYLFQTTFGYSAIRTGFAFLPFSGGIILGAGFSSRLLPRTGPRPLMMGGLLLAVGGLLLFAHLGVHSTYAANVLPGELIVSFGMGITFVPMSSTSLIGVDPADAGVASALTNATQQVGSSVGTAVLNTVAATAVTSYVAVHGVSHAAVAAASVHGDTTSFTVSAGLLGVAFVITSLLIRATRRSLPADDNGNSVPAFLEAELVGAEA
jgi:EmrB/QacA subfamily drug resistance transporter